MWINLQCTGSLWHLSYLVEKFDNLSTLKLPQYSPKPNPLEQVRQWLRKSEQNNP